jgi:amidohydrolase
MHACGHDMHTAILLGCAHVLSEMKGKIPGTVKLIFQPAEEIFPNGGALGMIKDGVLENPKVDGIIGLHVWPNFETGNAAIKEGPMMAASDKIFITIKGKSGHGSAPQEGIDAIAITANVINALQTIVSRNISPLKSAVISIGKIHGGYRYNVIAERVELEGTVRTLSPEIQNMMPEKIEQIVAGVAKAMSGDYEFKYVKGFLPTINDENLTAMVSNAFRKVLGKNFIVADKPAMAGEDFSFYSQKISAAYFWLGCQDPNMPFAPLHNSAFSPDEKCIPVGIQLMVNSAFEFLNE